MSTPAITGTFIKKTSRQERLSTSHPPRNGPISEVIPLHPAQVPIAFPRSSGSVKVAVRIASEPGTMNAPPTPCKRRARISQVLPGASPQATEVIPKNRIPPIMAFFRPYWSPIEPPGIKKAARVRI
ncbi:MAG: hypothetical protein BGO39_13355 [Chloroflexi bacterium 54-19]|nr:MAG: hypothetical protein BGO39_13355 [Chloroflexi bacterium 54-19]